MFFSSVGGGYLWAPLIKPSAVLVAQPIPFLAWQFACWPQNMNILSFRLQTALLACSMAVLSVTGEEGECSSRGLYKGEFFPNIGKIQYEGPDSINALSFRYYNADEVIMGKPMKEWCAAYSLPS